MAQASSIEWTQATWNPIAGCAVVSPGCTNCYAMKMAARHEAMSTAQGRVSPYDGLTKKTKAGSVWNGEMRLVESALDLPITWTKPRTIFVNSMSDLFADGVPDAWIDEVFARMAVTYRHTYQVLTKRSARMRSYLTDPATPGRIWDLVDTGGAEALINQPGRTGKGMTQYKGRNWPLPNVWMGVSTEDQPRAEERVIHLIQSPAAIRFVSAEPLLSGLDLTCLRDEFGWIDALRGERHASRPGDYQVFKWLAKLDLVIVGGESGPGSRACWTPAVRSVVSQCERAGVAVFVKQLGANVQDRNDAGFDGEEPNHWPDMDPADVEHDLTGYRDGYQGAPVRVHLRDRKGADMEEWPEDLRIRQLPEAAHA